MQDINIEEIKQYNNALKQQRDKAAALKAQIEYANNELKTLCAELSTELGMEVTVDNVEKIYEEQVAKIQSTLTSGNAVLAKIASEEQAQTVEPSPVAVSPVGVSPSPVQTPVATNSFVNATVQSAPVFNQNTEAQVVNTQPVPNIQPVVNAQPMQNVQSAPIFQTAPVNTNVSANGNQIPPLFNI